MMRFIIGLALLVSSVAAVARSGMTSPEPVRFEYVYEIAKYSCPRLEGRSDQVVIRLLGELKGKFSLTEHEFTVLMNYCLMFVQGRLVKD